MPPPQEDTWRLILKRIRSERCIPFLGAEGTQPGPSGVILIGKPLYGSGDFNALWKGDSLIMWSAAPGGLIIRWASQPKDKAMGGTYTVVGTGEGGRWATRLIGGVEVWQTKPRATAYGKTWPSAPDGTWRCESSAPATEVTARPVVAAIPSYGRSINAALAGILLLNRCASRS